MATFIYIDPLVLGIPFCFASLLAAVLSATASDLIAASILWWSFSPYLMLMCMQLLMF
jgi:hypothetical protein